MNDTSPDMAAKMQALYMQRSDEEKMRMSLETFDFARQLMIANLQAQGFEGAELRKQIFFAHLPGWFSRRRAEQDMSENRRFSVKIIIAGLRIFFILKYLLVNNYLLFHITDLFCV